MKTKGPAALISRMKKHSSASLEPCHMLVFQQYFFFLALCCTQVCYHLFLYRGDQNWPWYFRFALQVLNTGGKITSFTLLAVPFLCSLAWDWASWLQGCRLLTPVQCAHRYPQSFGLLFLRYRPDELNFCCQPITPASWDPTEWNFLPCFRSFCSLPPLVIQFGVLCTLSHHSGE